MSYSRNYHTSVHYSGSVSYTYGASEHGGSGTAHYSGSVPVNVTINVNTAPFDGSVAHFNKSVDFLTGSVVAMKTAQCMAIKQTSEEVSTALINGFFGTIKTEISQQLQALDSAIKAVFGLLIQQGKAVSDKKNVMEGDYNRISSRYIRLFADLDNECYKRIYALDKQSFNLSEKVQKKLLSESTSDAAANNLLSLEEVASSKTIIFISSLNRKVLDVMKTLYDYIMQETRINSLIESFLSNEETDGNISMDIPVIWSETDMLDGKASARDCHIPDYVESAVKSAITAKVDGYCSGSPQDSWKKTEEGEKTAINREFNTLAESTFAGADETSQRVYKTMMTLWQNAESVSLNRS